VIALAVACLAAPSLLTSPAFNSVGWVWLGLASEQVPSNDYNPLLPWFAMVLLGITVARLIPSKSGRHGSHAIRSRARSRSRADTAFYFISCISRCCSAFCGFSQKRSAEFPRKIMFEFPRKIC
jgi:uncharacterized membrane protein